MKQLRIIFLVLLVIISIQDTIADEEIFTEEEQALIESYEAEISKNLAKDNSESYRNHYEYIFNEMLENTDDISEKKVYTHLLESLIQKGEISETYLDTYNIDTGKVLQTWLDWQNKVRINLGLSQYVNNSILNTSALKWSKISRERGYIDHRRSKGDSYYNYKKIESWMKGEGVSCKNVDRKTFSESIGYGFFTCSDDECSDELIDGIKSTFNFFMSEKGKKYDPHYRAIVSPYFGTIGTGIELVKTDKNTYKYYLTTHYCTELITNEK